MEIIKLIQDMPIILFIPFATVFSIIGSIVITLLIMKWLELAFGYKEVNDDS